MVTAAKVTPPTEAPPVTPTTDLGKKVQAHQRYYASDGVMVPGVTTVLGVLAKPALVPWANRLGLKGIDSSKYVDETAAIGTLAHYLIECQLAEAEPELKDYTPAQVELANLCLETFGGWLKEHDVTPSLVEAQLVSDEHRYGGTIDCYGMLDGVPTLVDFKTSSGIYKEHHWQVSAYWGLLKEHGHECKGARIIRIGRDGSGLEEHVLSGKAILHGWKVFEHCLAIYKLQKKG